MNDLTHFIDESFWLALSFLLFVFLTYRPIKKAIVNSLDKRIEEIKNDLEQAQKLRDDAKIVLEQFELEMQHFEARKNRIIESAEQSTTRLVENTSKEVDLQINRMRDSAEKSIGNLKNKASIELKEEFTDHVMSLVRTYMTRTNANDTSDEQLIDHLLGKK